jgi:Ni/Fe-hydrogenase subunit HybB-like protein
MTTTSFGRWKFTPARGLLLLLFLAGGVVSVYRLVAGMGAVTNLSDTSPWGLWKAWDVIVVVPLGASGFTMAFVRYFLKAEKYEQIMRRSVIWAAIMYLSMGVRLAFDLGLPWRIVNPLIYWGNIHSALFEVAWCVFLYLIVLAVENLPRVLERFGTARAERIEHAIHWVAPAFVLGGVLLSSMHQSSLGTLYMIAGHRMDPLWYHPWLNYIYLLTAIAAGLSVTILLEAASDRIWKTGFATTLLAKLGTAVGVFLGIAFVWRIYSLAVEGQLGQLTQPRLATALWWAEMLLGYVLPLVLLSVRRWRSTRGGLVVAAAGVIFGMISLRLNVVFTAMNAALNSHYSPSVYEWLFSIGATAGTLVIFTWFAETLPGVLGKTAAGPTEAEEDSQVATAD